MSLAARATAPELMDGADVPLDDFAAILADLARVNGLMLGHRPTLRWLARAAPADGRFTLVDVGSGHGDMLRAIAARFPAARLVGVDLNPRSAPAARAATPPALAIEYLTGDAATVAPPDPDFIVSSLVAHHMTELELLGFLRWQEATAKRGWFVNDLHRHWLARDGFSAIAWALRLHPVVRHDGRLSVARAFRRADWERLLALAGVRDAAIRWWMPFRLCVERITK